MMGEIGFNFLTPASPLPPGAFKEGTVVAITHYTAVRYAAVASLVIALYDWSLCLKHEIRYIWMGRWNIGKWLYLILRYLSLTNLAIHVLSYVAPSMTHS